MSPQYPDVSVILPVYGVEKYIEKCVQSLLSQTLKDVQFIFVDDRGPDESIAILKRTIAGHPRERQFTILTPEHNLGAGMARNYGLQRASGRYIAFVDSDDVIEPTMLEDLFNAAISSKADICCCQLQKYDPDGRAGDIMANPNVGTGILTHEKRAYILTHYVSLFASFIYSSDFIRENDILFPPDRAADDSYFVSCAWMKAKSVAYVDRPLYHYIVRPGSVTTTRSSEKYKKRLAVFGKLMDYAREHGVRRIFRRGGLYVPQEGIPLLGGELRHQFLPPPGGRLRHHLPRVAAPSAKL